MSRIINRRQLLQTGLQSAAALGVSGFTLPAMAEDILVGPAIRDAERLVALPGKVPLIQVYDRPPVYETPTPLLIGKQNYPLTDREAYYVRWREALIPEIKPDELVLEIGGDAAVNPRSFTLAELRETFPETSVAAVGACKGQARGVVHKPVLGGVSWGKGDVSAAKWTGIPVKDVLEAVGVRDNAAQVAFKAAGITIAASAPEYWRVQGIDEMMRPEPLLAYGMNDGDIPLWNGAPLRLVNPGEYSPEWVKQVVRIEIRSQPIDNLWAGPKVGGPDPVRITSFVCTPADGTLLQVGSETELTGVAYDSGIGIAKVEVSLDEGASWEPATMEEPYGKYVWRVWHHQVTPKKKGPLRILTRATGVDGETQPMAMTEADIKSNGRRINAVTGYATYLETA